MKIFISYISVIFMLVGCASRPPSVSPPVIDTEIVNNTISSPKFNILNTIEVGDSLYSEIIKSDKQTFDVKLLTEEATSSLDNGYTLKVNKGMTGKLYKLKNKYPAFCDNLTAQASSVDVMGRGVNSCLVDFDNDGYFDKAMFSSYDRYFQLVPKVQYKKDKAETTSELKEEKFRREAVFQGMSNKAVKIMFREFYDNIIRNSFTQVIDYELDDNGKTIIAFKGFKAEVQKSTGIELTYKVISPFK